MVKRKANKSSAANLDNFAARLAQHGQAFMQMFDEEQQPDSSACKRAKVESPTIATPSPNASKLAIGHPAHGKSATKDVFADIWSDSKDGSNTQSQHSPALQHTMQTALSPAQAAAMKSERKRFMSGKTANVHRDLHPQQQQKQQSSHRQDQLSGTGPSRSDFVNMQREVQTFGADALDKKRRKEFDAWQLRNVQASPQKPGRVPAAIGKGMAKKRAEREQKAKEEAIASGMLKLKGSGKRKRQASDGDNRGLVEDGGLFKNGMLRVKGALGKTAKRGSKTQKRAFSSGKIGNLDGNSQKAWNVSRTLQSGRSKSLGRKTR